MSKIIKISLIPVIIGAGIGIFPLFESEAQIAFSPGGIIPQLLTIQENSLFPVSSPPSSKVVKRIKVVATAYSSSPQETDNDPFITASGTWVRDGIVANNKYSFGTKIRFPELYGDKVFVVEDRMHRRKGPYQFDIWFPDYWQALNFGAKRTYIEILES